MLGAGSPLALKELAHRARRGDRRSTSVNVPASYSARVSLLAPEVKRLCALHALANDAEALEAIFQGTFAALVDDAMVAGILEFESGLLRFNHPLFATAALAATSPSDRRQFHLVLAQTIDSTIHPDRVAMHRSEATLGVDDEVAGLMDSLAGRAKTRGALEEAARAMLRAAELSSDQTVRIRRMLITAELRYYSGDTSSSAALATRAAALTIDPVLACEAELMVAKATVGRATPRPPWPTSNNLLTE